jgi:hypothetical protein
MVYLVILYCKHTVEEQKGREDAKEDISSYWIMLRIREVSGTRKREH